MIIWGGLFCQLRSPGVVTAKGRWDFKLCVCIFKIWKMYVGQRHASWCNGQTLRGQATVYSTRYTPAVPALINPSTYTVSAWPRKMDGHPQGYLAVFGELRVAATSLYVQKVCSIASKKKKNLISIPEELWLGHKFKRDSKGLQMTLLIRAWGLWEVGAGNKSRRSRGSEKSYVTSLAVFFF